MHGTKFVDSRNLVPGDESYHPLHFNSKCVGVPHGSEAGLTTSLVLPYHADLVDQGRHVDVLVN